VTYECIEWLQTVKWEGSIAADNLPLCDAKIRLYLIRFLFLVVKYRNFLEYPVIVHLINMFSRRNYLVNKVKHDFFHDIITIVILLYTYLRLMLPVEISAYSRESLFCLVICENNYANYMCKNFYFYYYYYCYYYCFLLS
jgi:hypothetical protein